MYENNIVLLLFSVFNAYLIKIQISDIINMAWFVHERTQAQHIDWKYINNNLNILKLFLYRTQ